MRRFVVALGLLSLLLSQHAFSQSTNATVSGIVEDATGAVLPGVSVVATNNATGVVSNAFSNESGAYNFASLLPGVYKVSAELPGFQTKAYTDVQLGSAARVRLNFTMSVAALATGVEVTVAADTLLATSSSSVGEVLSQARIVELPNISNNVLDVYRLIPGVRVNDDGVSGSFAGLEGFGTTNIQRDGVDAAGGARFTANALTATYMSPDLIGEVKIVVAPVDAELGRGNAQLQFLTRSGTNQFRGSAVWNARNSALDANTWNNNNDVDPRTGLWKPTKPDWTNTHQFTGSYGGPIIKNKTFFFALWDQAFVNGRTTPNPVVLTPCARNGIFRYFDGWNNGNALQVTQPTTATPLIAVVDALGNPVAPATTPTGAPFSGALRYVSVFGPLANVPTRPDCSDAVISGSPWDTNRRALDSTGFVTKLIGVMPTPNNYDVGDGLNTAGFRWARNERDGKEGIFATTSAGLSDPTFLARKQINTKVDHNFNQSNKVGVSYTYERSSGNASGALEAWPGGYRGHVFRSPQILSVNFTTTVSSNLVNEVRLGMRRTGGNTSNGLNDDENGEQARAFFPSFNGYPAFVGLGAGQTNFQANQILGAGTTATYNDTTVQWTYGDSLSWTKGKHAFKFGGEIRRSSSLGYDAGIAVTSTPRALGGDTQFASIPAGAIGANIQGLAGTTTTGNNQTMRNLLSFLAGSLGSVTQYYYMQDPTNLNAYDDYKTFPQRVRKTQRNEFSSFVKDDWKILDSLTLNLGVRWDYFGSLYDGFGLMPLPTEGPEAIFGVSGRSFEEAWMKPGIRAAPTVFEFVGKNSPNPGKTYFPNDFNNFGPAIGFAWQVPWFGAGKTTVRGGYQMTYNGTPSFNSLTQTQVSPGSTLQATYAGDSGANAYLDLTKLPSLVPVPTIIKPMQAVPLSDRTQSPYIPQPGLVNPYAQNVTLSVARSISSNLTVDLRYIGTLGRKQWNVQSQINQANFLYNGLKDAFDAVRSGQESALLNSIFNGINIAGTGFGAVGTVFNGVQQTAGLHMRQSTLFRADLGNGNYQNLANTLNTLNYNSAFNPTLPAIPGGVNGQVLRHNGFPENFIKTNPQFNNAYMIANLNTNNYHSLETQVTLRPTRGITMQSTYTWSKNLGLFGETGLTYTNAVDRHADYAVLRDSRTHDFRTNGTFELPFGPNKMLFGGSSGVLARIVEGWQTGWIVNLNSGAPLSIAAQNMIYANGVADIVGPFDKKGKIDWENGANSGVYFMGGAVRQVRDPQCTAVVSTLQSLRDACTLNAVADAATGQILLQNPLPGNRGTVGLRSAEGPGRWRFDANLSKSIRISESKSVQFRVDATNVFNHPEPSTAAASFITNINDANFGLITGNNAKSTLRRQFQAQLRLNF